MSKVPSITETHEQRAAASARSESLVTLHEHGGFTVQGADGMQFMRVATLRSGIGLYMKCGIIPTRGATITWMLTQAMSYTGKLYKRGKPGQQAAYDDLGVWLDAMRAALPYDDQRSPETRAKDEASYEATRRAAEGS